MTSPFLAAALGLLAVDAAIELGFISGTVAFMHNGPPHTTYTVQHGTATFTISGLPAHLLVDQGHTSNGAAGTAFVLIAALGTIALTARAWFSSGRARPGSLLSVLSRSIYYLWLALQVPALLLTTGALAYVFIVTRSHAGQAIDQDLAAQLAGAKYPLDAWTPQNWFAAVTSQLRLVNADLQGNLVWHLRIMRGWQYNLIPLFLLQLAETVLAFVEFRYWRLHVFNHIPFHVCKA